MKAGIILLLLIFLGTKYCHSQDQNRLSIPIVKENAIVDTAINFILSGKAVPIVQGRPTNDRWIIFDIDTTGQYSFSFSASKESEKAINFLVNRLTSLKIGLGYFRYHDYFICVRSEKSFDLFFQRTPKSTSFDFLYKLKSVEPTNEIKEQHESWSYNYENGRFLRDLPPTIH